MRRARPHSEFRRFSIYKTGVFRRGVFRVKNVASPGVSRYNVEITNTAEAGQERLDMDNKKTSGALEVLAAYVSWGLLTVFWNLLAKVDSVYILAQRILWSMVFMGILLVFMKRWEEIRRVLQDRRQMLLCLICGILVSVNWGVYIYAVNSGHVLDASLGYFIEPLLVALIGIAVFRERLNRYEKLTYLFSAAGLIYMIAVTRMLPMLALLIAGSFAVYGAVKKMLKISPMTSLFMETLCMTPAALLFVVHAETVGTGSVGVLNGAEFLLLPACGVVTSIPLLLYNLGVREIPYYLSGILMFVNPTLQFVMGLFYFHEALDFNRLVAFGIIWIGIGILIFGNVRMMNQNKGVRVSSL